MRVRDGRTRGMRLAGAAAAAVLAVLATACTGSHNETMSPAGNGASPSSSRDPAVTFCPANGARAADPSAGVTVTATRGTLKSVTVTAAAGGDLSGAVPGTLNAAGTAWHSTSPWALGVSQRYTVTATAAWHGTTKTTTSTFRTLTPSSTFSAHIFEGAGQTYGVGMPIILTFSQPSKNKTAIERSIEIKTSRPVIGAWYWDTGESLVFRTRDYWPPNTSVSFTGHFNGVEGARGMYGNHTLTQSFSIGQSVIAVASTKAHRTQIYVDGKLKYNWPISSGRPGDDTPNGSYLTIEKENPV